jgi:hypothetical protein
MGMGSSIAHKTTQLKPEALVYSIFLFFFSISFCSLYVVRSEKADLKSRSDSLNGPPTLDAISGIYTTPTTGFHLHNGAHHHHHLHHDTNSPEAMKVRMAAMILQPPTRV